MIILLVRLPDGNTINAHGPFDTREAAGAWADENVSLESIIEFAQWFPKED